MLSPYFIYTNPIAKTLFIFEKNLPRLLFNTTAHEAGLHHLGIDLPGGRLGERLVEPVLRARRQRDGQRHIRAVVGLLNRAVVVRQQVQNDLIQVDVYKRQF